MNCSSGVLASWINLTVNLPESATLIIAVCEANNEISDVPIYILISWLAKNDFLPACLPCFPFLEIASCNAISHFIKVHIKSNLILGVPSILVTRDLLWVSRRISVLHAQFVVIFFLCHIILDIKWHFSLFDTVSLDMSAEGNHIKPWTFDRLKVWFFSLTVSISVISIALFCICSRNDQKICDIWSPLSLLWSQKCIFLSAEVEKPLLNLLRGILFFLSVVWGCFGAEQGRNSAVVPQQRKSCLLLYLWCNNQ